MMRLGTVAIAGLAAIALHLAAFAAVAPHLRAAAGAGEGGQALLTLTAADPALSALVADWDRPPAVATPTPKQPAASLPDAGLAIPAISPPANPTIETAALPVPSPDVAPRPDTTAPAPPPPPEQPAAAAKAIAKAKAPPPAPVPAQQAAGTGGKTVAGQANTSSAATNPQGSTAAKAEWGAAIRARIERRKAYPAAAGGAAGKVTLRLVVGADGRLVSVTVAQSSGMAALDRAALSAVKAAGRFPKAPKGQGQTSFSLPITFAP